MERRKIVPRYGMIIDLDRCNGCYNCQIACKDEYVGNDFLPYSKAQPLSGHFWMRIEEKERGQFPRVWMTYFPIPCQHCQNQVPCMKAGTTGAIKERPDGIILIDPEKSRGKKELVNSCPFGAIFWNEKDQIPQKCTFCAHLLDSGWKEPRCVEACPTGALLFGDLSDPESEISKVWDSERIEILHPEFGLRPRVKYISIPKRFIAGTVIFKHRDECAENVKVTLSSGGKKQTVRTNNFGDFEFEGLEEGGDFSLKIEHSGYTPQSFKVQTKLDVYLGEILLRRSSQK
jgi:Fe-S-cluster-containing dehydrogenase component